MQREFLKKSCHWKVKDKKFHSFFFLINLNYSHSKESETCNANQYNKNNNKNSNKFSLGQISHNK